MYFNDYYHYYYCYFKAVTVSSFLVNEEKELGGRCKTDLIPNHPRDNAKVSCTEERNALCDSMHACKNIH